MEQARSDVRGMPTVRRKVNTPTKPGVAAQGALQLLDINELSPYTINRDACFTAGPGNPRTALPQASPLGSPTSRRTSFDRPPAVVPALPNLARHIDLFFAKLYPIWPILNESSFRESLNHPEQLDNHQTCLVLSICALSALHIPGSTSPASEPRKLVAQRFIDQCLQLRSSFDCIETATILTVQTSLFLSCAEVEFQRARSAWFLLREAIMLAQELGFFETAELSPKLSQVEVLSIQRTLFILSLTERGLTILRNKPFTITMFDSPPEERFENEDPGILLGLQSLSRLFSLLDKQFLDTWINGPEDISAGQATVKILAAQQTLASMRFDVDNLTDIQKADILITQQWLRLVFWQWSMRQGLLSSSADELVLSYNFPCRIAKSLCAVLESLPAAAILGHGMAIVSFEASVKLFQIDILRSPADHTWLVVI